eukprot:11172218-Lingulodinium_polyedra.AAC.1
MSVAMTTTMMMSKTAVIASQHFSAPPVDNATRQSIAKSQPFSRMPSTSFSVTLDFFSSSEPPLPRR